MQVLSESFVLGHLFCRFTLAFVAENRIRLRPLVTGRDPVRVIVGLLGVPQDPFARVDVVVLVLDRDLLRHPRVKRAAARLHAAARALDAERQVRPFRLERIFPRFLLLPLCRSGPLLKLKRTKTYLTILSRNYTLLVHFSYLTMTTTSLITFVLTMTGHFLVPGETWARSMAQ